MNQGQLKKEFKKKDVTRMRNLITGKSGEKTQTLTGYEKKIEDHKEGEVWEELGRNWTIKNGIKQNITKTSKLKSLSLFPIACPKCKKAMKSTNLNKQMYAVQGMCYDCVIENEHKIRVQGKWNEYRSEQLTANKNSGLKDFEAAVESWYNEKDQFFTEAGDTENWNQGDKKKAYEEIKERIEEMRNIKL
jgi:hypothetical protein